MDRSHYSTTQEIVQEQENGKREVRKRGPVFSAPSSTSPQPFQRLGHELHDGLAQTLWFVCVQTQLLEKNLKQFGEVSQDALQHLQHISTLALNEVRTLIDMLDSSDSTEEARLVDFGSYLRCASDVNSADSFPLALSEYMQALNPGDIHFDFDWSCYVPQPYRQEAKLFRIAQSAISNAVRHARARHIHVRLGVEGPSIYLRVQDDGQGITPTRKRGYGLRIMEERVVELGGRLNVSSANPCGTLVQVAIPRGDRHVYATRGV